MSQLKKTLSRVKKQHTKEKTQLYKKAENISTKFSTKLATMECINQNGIDNAFSELKTAVKIATMKERTHYVKYHEKVKTNLKRKNIEEQTKVATLMRR